MTRLILVVLATLRATRFITSDWLGEWWIVRPAKTWVALRESPIQDVAPVDIEPDSADGWRSKLVKGLDCPFCVGFWIGGIVIAGELLTRTRLLRPLRPLWTFGLAMLGLNYIVGHVSSRIDG